MESCSITVGKTIAEHQWWRKTLSALFRMNGCKWMAKEGIRKPAAEIPPLHLSFSRITRAISAWSVTLWLWEGTVLWWSNPSLFCYPLNCFSPSSRDGKSTVTSGATHLFLLQPLQKHRGWAGRWKICLWGEIGQISESNNWETDAVFLPHHTGASLKHTRINCRLSSMKAIPCTWKETTSPSRLGSVARSLMYEPLTRYMTRTRSWEAQSGRFRIKTLLGTHLLGFMTLAREQFLKVFFVHAVDQTWEKQRNRVIFSCSYSI